MIEIDKRTRDNPEAFMGHAPEAWELNGGAVTNLPPKSFSISRVKYEDMFKHFPNNPPAEARAVANSDERFCKDCKHFESGWHGFPLCAHPDQPLDPIFGRKDTSCSLARGCNTSPPFNKCGPEGNLFEAKEQP